MFCSLFFKIALGYYNYKCGKYNIVFLTEKEKFEEYSESKHDDNNKEGNIGKNYQCRNVEVKKNS